MKRVLSILCAVMLLAMAAPAVDAQPKTDPPAKAKKAKKTKKAKKRSKATRCKKGEKRVNGECVRDLIFGIGDDIDGDTPNGYGDFLTATRGVLFKGLIRLRTNFHSEILKSADEI